MNWGLIVVGKNEMKDSAVEVTLPPEAMKALEALLATPGSDFAKLARAAGLDPARDFRGQDLCGIDFAASDLTGFDFSGADLRGSDLSRAKWDRANVEGASVSAMPRFLAMHGHEGAVTGVSVSPDGSRIVSAGADGTIRVWDARIGEVQGKPLLGHSGPVFGVACSPDGETAASVGADGTLRLWDIESGEALLRPLRGHEGPVHAAVHAVAFSHDGTRIATGGKDATLRIWDANTGKPLGELLRGHEYDISAVVFSFDDQRLISSSADGTLRRWDSASYQQLGDPLSGHTIQITSIALSSDGTRIVSGDWSGRLRLWDAKTGMMIAEPLLRHGGMGVSVAFSPDGKMIMSSGGDGELRLWDGRTMAALGKPCAAHNGTTYSVAFSPDGKYVVSGGNDGVVRLTFMDTLQSQIFITARPEDDFYARELMRRLLKHPDIIRREITEAMLDPNTHPRPDEGARDALENSVAAIFVVGDKEMALMQKGEFEMAQQLSRETGFPRIIPVFISSAIQSERPSSLAGHHFAHMPLDKKAAFDALVEAICQAADGLANPPGAVYDMQDATDAAASLKVDEGSESDAFRMPGIYPRGFVPRSTVGKLQLY